MQSPQFSLFRLPSIALSPLVVALLITVFLGGCDRDKRETIGPSGIFIDRAEAAGLDFAHFNGMSGELYLCEIMGPGCAFFDFDNDGDLDIFVTQNHMLGAGKTFADAVVKPRDSAPLIDRLYKNELAETGTLSFSDITTASGIDGPEYGMGVAAGDYDNDGWLDLYVTNFGPNRLWHNNGDGTFSEVSGLAGVDDPRWSISAAFLDFDRDGFLDLYVSDYVDYAVAANKLCLGPSGKPNYCAPTSYVPESDRLYRNRGDGTFEDVSRTSGIADRAANGLGVVTADFNGDGWIDIYVANDIMHNLLWLNQHDGTFQDEALFAGCAVDESGSAQSSMGVAAGDFDNDGDEDLFVAHMVRQTSTLYLNEGDARFRDITLPSKVAELSAEATTYGTAFVDFDNDGRLDIAAANGSMVNVDSQILAGESYPMLEPNQLYRNVGDRTFADVSDQAPVLAIEEVSRGLAAGDVDNDGDVDLLVANSNGPLRLFINQVGQDANWIGLRLVGGDGPRDMLGAQVTVIRADGIETMRHIRTDGSYCSSSDPRVVVGLGDSAESVVVRVRWPDGEVEKWSGLYPGSYHTLQKKNPVSDTNG